MTQASQPISCDIVVLGGGPAGSAAAATAAQAGHSVALVDKAVFPRDKLCGGLFTGRSRLRYREIFGRDIPEKLFEERRKIAFHLDGKDMGRMDDVPPMYLSMRWDLDHHLLQLAETAGAELLLGQRGTELDLEAGALRLRSGAVLRYKVLIGADGVNSAVARALFGRAFDPQTIGFALEKELPPLSNPDIASTVRVDFNAADWGYGWSFPKRGSTTVGIGGVQVRNPDMKARLRAYGALLDQGDVEGMKGHFLPFGDFKKRPGKGNVVLAGDAAGFVDPITGEGIGYALESGQMAAQAGIEALAANAPARTARIYQRKTRTLRRELTIARVLRPIVFSKPMAPVFRRSFAGSQKVKRAYMRMLAGETDYPALLRLVARRLPAAVWRSLRGSAR